MKVAICHLKVEHGQKQRNLERLITYLHSAAEEGADLIVTPELSLSGYSYPSTDAIRKVAETVPGKATARVAAIARCFGCFICVAMAERDDNRGRVYNSVVAIDRQGDIVARHRKFTAERAWASAGTTLANSIFDTPWARIGLLICSDSYYGILPRAMAAQGAELLLVPANWPPGNLDPREVWSARARENHMFIAINNRTGKDLKMDCATAVSEVIAPDGNAIMEETSEDSRVFFCDLPTRNIQKIRSNHRPLQRLNKNAIGEFQQTPDLKQTSLSISFAVCKDQAGVALEEIARWTLSQSASSRHLLLLPTGIADVNAVETLRATARRLDAVICAALPDKRVAVVDSKTGTKIAKREQIAKTPVLINCNAARVALISLEQIGYPEIPYALSAAGCDMILLLEERISEAQLNTAAVRSVERLAVAVSTARLAVLFHPPEGHNRWREQRCEKSGIVTWSVNLDHTRDKTYLPRVDYTRLFEEVQSE
ncbi:MAG: carbon-nitrogen hydrolase family protein [Deltaproteobacteria bacterium]|nr:carbon-nitrogen hydrolase family protein [Deltaproteobacteria bacterium]